MVGILLTVTFAAGVCIAIMHVVNRKFVAPVYDVFLNLIAFIAAVTSSWLLHEVLPASFAALAMLCWLWLARRTWLHHRARRAAKLTHSTPSTSEQDTHHPV